MSIDTQKSESGLIGEFTNNVAEATDKLFDNKMNYEKLTKQEAMHAFFGLAMLLAFPIFVGYMYVSSLFAISPGLPSFLMAITTLFFGALLVAVTLIVQGLLAICVIWIAGFIKHLSS